MVQQVFLAAATVAAIWTAAVDPWSSIDASPKPHSSVPVDNEATRISQWVRQLGSRKFAERQAATESLIAAGAAAVGPVAAAAESAAPEVSMRSLRILEALLRSGDAPARAAARAALERLSRSEHAFVARQASEALEEPSAPPDLPGGNAIGPRGPLRGFAIGGRIRVNSRTINGRREIDVLEEDRRIRITDHGGRDIVVRITETADGHPRTAEFAAPSLAELRQKHPEAAEFYEAYTTAPAGVLLFGGRPPLRAWPQPESFNRETEWQPAQ